MVRLNKLISISKLKKKADALMSEYVRKRDKNVCFTCGKKGTYKSMQCGHYVSRSWNLLRYHEKNCHCQDVGCNIFKKGNMDEYAIRLKKKYGDGILEEIHKLKVIHKYSRQELEDIITDLKHKIEHLNGEDE